MQLGRHHTFNTFTQELNFIDTNTTNRHFPLTEFTGILTMT